MRVQSERLLIINIAILYTNNIRIIINGTYNLGRCKDVDYLGAVIFKLTSQMTMHDMPPSVLSTTEPTMNRTELMQNNRR